jgi:hypothetical protein
MFFTIAGGNNEQEIVTEDEEGNMALSDVPSNACFYYFV